MAEEDSVCGMPQAQLPAKCLTRLLFAAGANLMMLNFILVQHFVVALRQPETAVILFSLAYFIGISCGYFFSGRISISHVQRLIPFFMLVQMAMLAADQAAAYALRASAGLPAACAVLFAGVAVFFTSIYAIVLPAAISTGGQSLRRAYSIEILGSMTGLIAAAVCAMISHALLLGLYFSLLLLMAVWLGAPRRTVGLMVLAGALYSLSFTSLDQNAANWVYRQRYADKKFGRVIETRYTPYHKIEIAERRDRKGYLLLLNGRHQFSDGSYPHYSYFVAQYPSRFLQHPKVAVLGCGSMATVGRIGEHAREIRIVDLDEQVFKAAEKYFQKYNRLLSLDNWSFVPDDAKHYLASREETFDLILHDIPPARSRQTALTYTKEFFELVKSRLEPGGLFSMSSLTPLDGRSTYGRKVIATLTTVFEHYFVLIHGQSVYFYGGSASFNIPDRQKLQDAIEHKDREKIRILIQDEVDALVKGEEVITINNVGDLIFA